ncbi:hypothetical protein Tco_0095713 [Tanacetum coccineum]
MPLSMIYQALKTWFQTYGVLLKLLMIDMRYEVSHIRENNIVLLWICKRHTIKRRCIFYKSILAVTHVKNRLTNLSGDDVVDFAIALRMFTRSLVIQKRVEDLQLGVESYQ